ncbi:hypothetical protein ACFLRM_06350 [Acidobacteriota bacterium]
MNKTSISLIFIISLAGNFCFCQHQMSDDNNLERERIETYLRSAEVTSINKELEAGRTEPWVIGLYDGKTERKGFFKYLDRTRPSIFPDSYKYEIAAYEINKLLDIKIVPPVVEREIEGINGALQLFLENFIKESERKRRNLIPKNPVAFSNRLEEIGVFEILVNCQRIDLDDILISSEDWEVFRVDFSQAFSTSSEMISGSEISRCSRKLYHNLHKLEYSNVESRLKSYLTDQQIKALLKRKNVILENINQLIKIKGEEAILF